MIGNDRPDTVDLYDWSATGYWLSLFLQMRSRSTVVKRENSSVQYISSPKSELLVCLIWFTFFLNTGFFIQITWIIRSQTPSWCSSASVPPTWGTCCCEPSSWWSSFSTPPSPLEIRSSWKVSSWDCSLPPRRKMEVVGAAGAAPPTTSWCRTCPSLQPVWATVVDLTR